MNCVKTMKTTEEIRQILEEHKDEVIRKYKVREIGIFGSFVRGEQKKRSDIDILVEFDEKNIPGLLKFIEMERYLEKLLRRKVDLVRKGGIRPELREIILKEVVYI
jgi:predicted nucleotidyltransferase